jgi:hypothetical protein
MTPDPRGQTVTCSVLKRSVSVAAVVLAAACLWLPLSSSVVERWYSLGIYPPIQHLVTPVSNRLPFAVLDALLVLTLVLVVWGLVWTIRTARRTRSLRPVAQFLWRLVTAGAVLYLLFLALWGFNYRRVPMAQRVQFHRPSPNRAAVLALAQEAVTRMNALHDDAHRTGWTREEWQNNELRVAFAKTQRLLTDGSPAVPGRLKKTLLGPYFRWASVDGMVNPFGLEVLANPDLTPWERPFVAAHEWSHLAGYADESEANFVGWLTCVRGDPPAQYSGWLFLYWQILGELGASDRKELAMSVAPGPRQDLEAIVERLRRGQLPFLRDVSWRVYDQYLKANRVQEGVRSYSEVLNLLLGTRFDDGWVPLRR